VEDLEFPVFTYCPNDTLIKIERNELTAIVTPNIPDTLDNCGIVLQTWSLTGATIATSPVIGINVLGLYTFNLGITTVTYHVEDLAGNAAECVFNVNVEIKEPEILNVTIPDASMKIGDIISATITVGDDGGQIYSMISGTVGGYPLTNFQRINSTTYLANFTIIEGGNSYLAHEPIPVANLVVTDGVIPSLPYILPIIQANDLLDAEIPVVFSMIAVPGAYKIGDVLNINITANGLNYSIHPNSIINGIYLFFELPNVIFTDLGGGNYRLSYMIEEGNIDVAPGELNVSVMLVKPSGNSSIEYTTVINTEVVSIDAHPPVVTRLEAPSIEVGVGGTVQITITADGEDYTAANGTTINGVPLSSPRVTFSELTGGLYELSYIVDSGDSDVAPGMLGMSMVMNDPSGNTNLPFSTILSNSLEIYTELPMASLAGTPEICEEEEAVLSVFLTGRSPWSFDLSDGSTITPFTDVTLSEYQVIVTPDKTTTYRITSITDRNGVVNSGTGNFEVTVNKKTDVEIINLATGYSVEADPVTLEANISGGTFSGPGVVIATGIFYPALADTVNSPHTILYTYENANGCISVDSALVFVLGAEGDVFIPTGLVCDDGDPFKVTASNVAGVNGSFTLQNAGGQVVSGLTDHGDNTATIDPTQLSAGDHTIVYRYVDGVPLYIRVSFLVESVPEPVITSLDQTTFCQSDLPVLLQADEPAAVFSGPGVIGDEVDGFFFDPAQANLGGNTIICTVTTLNGCSKSSQKDVLILFAPEMDFTISTACIPLDGGIVSFNNLTSGKILVESWAWDFDDPGSGQNNQSDLVDPTHFYSGPGERSISLTATTFDGCVASYVLDTTIGYQPVADFTWISDCFANGSGVKFLNRSSSGTSSIDSLVWTFKTSTGGVLGSLATNSTTDTVAFPFVSVDSYLVDLYTLNEHGCSDIVSKELVLRPTVQLENEDYQENFDASGGMWIIGS
ncbi:MAG: HYR domain-containing protein, partial [Bacteroidales bacterium]|nr:HYR domain-containing protein [Bacteroidales bacterium]